MQMDTELTRHARQRQLERKVLTSVVRELQTTAARFVGHKVGGSRVEYRVVRHGRTYWIATITAGGVTTFYAHDEQSVLRWARNYLLNPEQSTCRLRRLVGHRTPDETVTDELSALWLGAGQAQVTSGRLNA